ncbi:MAG: hypothetical protein QOG56_1404 [Solirubrobacteraceae bacterium]|nr:hypothetical protein [Solirubrobacteraceae bacterium]
MFRGKDAHQRPNGRCGRASTRALAAGLTTCVALLCGATSAWAGVGFSMVPTVPQDVTVGATGVRSSLVIINQSVNGFGESGYSTDSYRLTKITLVPSCASRTFGEDCPVGSADPGVLVPNPMTGRGRTGSACENRTFAITTTTPGDPAMGKYSFNPDSPVVLGPSDGSFAVRRCIVDFTVDVRKAPRDSDGDSTNGLQTDQKASTAGIDIGPENVDKTGGGVGTAGTTVALHTPAIATNASAPIVLGAGQLSDFATVSDLVSPVTTGANAGKVTFRLYGPDDDACNISIFSSGVKALTYNAPANTAGSASSGSTTPPGAGTYRWRAFYGGDANNTPVAGGCNDADEMTEVSKAKPSITTHASDDTKLGGSLSDVATVTGRVSPVGSSVVFRLYGPDNETCTGTPLFTSTVTLPTSPVSPVSVTSQSYKPTEDGTYRWVATYGGDRNNVGVAGVCGEADEMTVVTKATPSITTRASDDTKLGGNLSDVATVTGRVSPTGSSSVVFRLYGPGNETCTGTPTFTSTVTLPSSPASPVSVTSQSYKPTEIGTYRWVATYGGDDNNVAIAGVCGEADEMTVVTKAKPAITTQASDETKLGGNLSDVATVTGRVSPTGSSSVVFRLYGPDNASCTGTAVFTSTIALPSSPASPVSVTSQSYKPTAIGTYRWVASYGGDDNNSSAAGECGEADETTVVTKATPAIATQASPDMALGGKLTDTATVTGLVNAIKGTNEATVEFRLYGANDASCATVVFTSSKRPLTFADQDTTATATSEAFAPPTTGTYRWRAFFSGDTNNVATNGPCNAAGESTDVRLASPTIDTQASPNIGLGGGSLSDTAKVSGLVEPVVSGTGAGTVEFRLYGPDDATCTTAILTSPARPLALNAGRTVGTASSEAFTPEVGGTYRWRAFYSGDANNVAASGACNDANEQTTVTTPPPPKTTTPPPVSVPPPPPPPPAGAVAPAAAASAPATYPCTPSPGPAPAGGELCARGTAAISGKAGCQGTPFRVTVSGREIERVVFTMDGKTVRVLSSPNSGDRWVLPVNPRTKRPGVHRVLARVIFSKQSGTRSRTLRTAFSRCGRRAVMPAFTG